MTAGHHLVPSGPRRVRARGRWRTDGEPGQLGRCTHGAARWAGGEAHWLEGPRLPGRHTHGTGCVLSSAIAAHLARGDELTDAVRAGKTFVTEAIRHALAIGHGIGPVDPMFALPVEAP